MVRGKVEVKRIENKLKRQKTFCIRKNNLLKKASELSVLCDADVAVIVFSSCGKLYEFGNAGVSETLERYQRCRLIPQENVVESSWYKEMSELQANYQSFQRTQRHLLGEDLGPLSVKELQDLEKQLEGALAKTRERMTQLMMEQLEEHRMKVLQSEHMNNQLKSKVSLHMPSMQVDDKSSLMTLPWSYGNYSASHILSTLEFDNCTKPVQQMGYQYAHGEGSSVPKTESTGLQGWVI